MLGKLNRAEVVENHLSHGGHKLKDNAQSMRFYI